MRRCVVGFVDDINPIAAIAAAKETLDFMAPLNSMKQEL